MSRRVSAPKREIIPDAKYGDRLVAKFVNSLMMAGKRSTAEKCLYGAFDIIEERYKEEALDVFKKALDSVKPRVEVKSRRVGGTTYQVQRYGRINLSNAAAVSDLKRNAYLYRNTNSKSDKKPTGISTSYQQRTKTCNCVDRNERCT